MHHRLTAGLSLLAAALPCAGQPDCANGPSAPVAITGTPGADAQFGWSVADVGDADGDGLGELAVGARLCTVGGLPAVGAVFLVSEDGTAVEACFGEQQDEHFGESIAGGADANGDSSPDFVVGAPLRNAGTGAVEVILGGSAALPRWATFDGEAGDDWFGQSVAIGDLTGDGVAEVIVGAPYNDRSASAAGAVFIYQGGATAPSAPMLVLTGEASNDHFGWSVAYLGDFDGDGFGDMAVGARLHGPGPARARGKAYLYRGGAPMDNVADGFWNGESANDWMGQSMAGPGDVDGGGRPDLLVGAPFNDSAGGFNAGAAYLFRGEDAFGSAPAAVYRGESADAQLGWSVGGGADVNADGRPDVVVGARFEDPAGRDAAGRASVYTSVGPSPHLWSTIDGRAAGDWLGNSVSGAAAHLGPMHAAAFAGAPLADDAASASGEVLRLACPKAGSPGCQADIDGVEGVTVFDLLAYLDAWFAGGAAADIDGTPGVDVFDLLAYLDLWFAGC